MRFSINSNTDTNNCAPCERQDGSQVWWGINPEGVFLRYDGQQWIPAQPPQITPNPIQGLAQASAQAPPASPPAAPPAALPAHTSDAASAGEILCQICGARVNPASKFCKMCGAPVPPLAAPQPAPASKCPNCGASLNPGARFCGSCGYKF